MGLLVLLVATFVRAPGTGAAEAPDHATWTGRYSVVADGQQADGWLAYPTDIVPDTLLVFAHGCCTPLEWSGADVLALHHARHNGMVVVAMDYRGPLGGWNVGSGHADVVAATADLRQRFPIRRSIVWGVSMGGEVAAMAAAARPDLFDYVISSSGVMDLSVQWAQQTFRAAIESETGGSPLTAAAAYDRRSPVALAPSMHGVDHVYLLHGTGDTAVPWSQAQQMYDALVGADVPVSSYSVTTSDGDPTVWWPVFGTHETPVSAAGHDWSTIALGQRILLSIASGSPPDWHSAASQHVWDATLDVMAP